MSPHLPRDADAVVGKGAPLPLPDGGRALVGQARQQSLEPRPLVSGQPTRGREIKWNPMEPL